MATIPFKSVIFLMPKHLSLSPSTTQLSVSASSSSTCSSTVDYLTNKCGFPLKSAIATSRKLRGFDENKLQRYDSVIHLFKSHGFDDSDIAKMIQKRPDLLNIYKVEDNLKPKLEFLVQSGFAGPRLHQLIVSNPDLLVRSLNDRIKPSLDFLRSFLGTEERLKLAVQRGSRLLSYNLKATLQPNIDLLTKEGVPVDNIRKYLVQQPRHMQPKVDRLVSAIEMVQDILDMRPADPKFLHVVLRLAGIGVPRWEKKLQVFKSLGFSQQEAFSIFKSYPECFGLTEKKLESKMSFYFNTVKLKTDDIIRNPVLVGLSIERRIRPRHNVLKLLWSKKLRDENAKIASLFVISNKVFLRKYVIEYLQEVPSLLETYKNDIASQDQ